MLDIVRISLRVFHAFPGEGSHKGPIAVGENVGASASSLQISVSEKYPRIGLSSN